MDTRYTRTVEIKSSALKANGEFSALLSPYGGPPDHHGDIVDQGAYADTLRNAGNRRVLLSSHDPTKSIGWVELEDRRDGLYISRGVLLINDIVQAAEDYARLKAGILTGVSIGFETLDEYFVRNERHLKTINLLEASLVVFPAAHRARVTDVKRRSQNDVRPALEELLRNMRSVNTLSRHRNADEIMGSIQRNLRRLAS